MLFPSRSVSRSYNLFRDIATTRSSNTYREGTDVRMVLPLPSGVGWVDTNIEYTVKESDTMYSLLTEKVSQRDIPILTGLIVPTQRKYR